MGCFFFYTKRFQQLQNWSSKQVLCPIFFVEYIKAEIKKSKYWKNLSNFSWKHVSIVKTKNLRQELDTQLVNVRWTSIIPLNWVQCAEFPLIKINLEVNEIMKYIERNLSLMQQSFSEWICDCGTLLDYETVKIIDNIAKDVCLGNKIYQYYCNIITFVQIFRYNHVTIFWN